MVLPQPSPHAAASTGSHQRVRPTSSTTAVRRHDAGGCGGSTAQGASSLPPLPWPLPAGKSEGASRLPSHPASAAARMMTTNETWKKKIATNEAAASPHKAGERSALPPIRISAAATMAMTAGSNP